MKINKIVKQSKAIKLEAVDGKKVIGRAHLYLISNGLHKRPYGLMEDVFIEKECRGQGIGTKLITELIKAAKKEKCYKLIATSRTENEGAHRLYKKLGLKQHGLEFRMDFEAGGVSKNLSCER
jgi:GNAT superfamily N-acetyltransferase